MEKILLNNIAEELVAKSGISREMATNFMHVFFKTIEKGLHEDGMVKVKGLGTFKLQNVSERGSVDVNTGERIIIKGYSKVAFIPDSSMKEFVNRPFAHFEPTELNDGYLDEEVISTDDCNNADVANEIGEENEAEEVVEEDMADIATVKEDIVVDGIVNVSEAEETIAEDTVEEESKSVDMVESVPQSNTSRNERRGCWWFVIFLFLVLATLFIGYFSVNPVAEKPLHEEVEGKGDIRVNPNLEEELAEEWADVQMVSVQSSEEMESVLADSMDKQSAVVESAPDTLSVEGKSATVSIVETLQAKNLKDITPADTTDYVVVGVIAVHKLKRGETIIQLSNKYYGDKRLWPYIVAYNRMERFNSVAIGQEIRIPLLEEK